jgi:ubiquitin-protein ligase
MISFTCPGCGRSFSVPDAFAGRKATCKTCGGIVTVPTPPPSPASEPAPVEPAPNEVTSGKIPLRIRRLQSDAKHLTTAFKSFPLIRVTRAEGTPPDLYEVEYLVRGLERGRGNKPVPREIHKVEIRLTADYPRLPPHCKMLTPIFHPNIDPSTICVGDHWAAGERLADLIVRIGELIAYQAYNIKSPLDAEAAMWADLHSAQLPVDPRNLHPAEL